MSRAKIIDVTNGTKEQFRKLCFLTNYEITNISKRLNCTFLIFKVHFNDRKVFSNHLNSN